MAWTDPTTGVENVVWDDMVEGVGVPSGPISPPVQIPFGAVAHLDVTQTTISNASITATLSSPCPDSQLQTDSKDTTGEEIDLVLQVKPQGDIPPDSECQAALGSIDLAFRAWKGIVSLRSGASSASAFVERSLWMDQYSIAAAASRGALRFTDTDGVEVLREGIGGQQVIRQVFGNGQLVDVVDLPNGFELRYYHLYLTPAKVNGFYPVDPAGYSRAWRVENLGPDAQGNQRLQVSQVIPTRTNPGPVTVFALYSMDPSGELTLTKNGATAEKKKELAVDPDQPQAAPDPENRDHWIIRGTYDCAGQPSPSTWNTPG